MKSEDWAKLIFGAVVGVVMGALGMMFANWWTSKSPYLWITGGETITFPGVKNQFAIVGFAVINDGTKEAEDVQFSFNSPDSAVQEVRAIPDSFGATASFDSKTHDVSGRLGTVNVGESFQVSAMVTNPDKLPAKITPKVRGKGVVGSTAKRQIHSRSCQ
jgi:hypothetical protein